MKPSSVDPPLHIPAYAAMLLKYKQCTYTISDW
jgi:hypothetical protein